MGLPACQTRRMAPGGLTRSYSAPSRPTSLVRGCAEMCTCPPLGAEECTRVSAHSNRSRSRPAEYLRSVPQRRSEEHTSELQSLMRISYAVFCLKKKNTNHQHNNKMH